MLAPPRQRSPRAGLSKLVTEVGHGDESEIRLRSECGLRRLDGINTHPTGFRPTERKAVLDRDAGLGLTSRSWWAGRPAHQLS